MKEAYICVFVLLVTGLITAAATNDTASLGHSTNRFDPADWGPAYVAGMEHGPASMEHSRAMGMAQAFMAKQNFADKYAKRACSVGGPNMEVEFALLADKTGRTRGIVRVNIKTGKCTWMGNNKLKEKTPNQAPEDTARKLADPQR